MASALLRRLDRLERTTGVLGAQQRLVLGRTDLDENSVTGTDCQGEVVQRLSGETLPALLARAEVGLRARVAVHTLHYEGGALRASP